MESGTAKEAVCPLCSEAEHKRQYWISELIIKVIFQPFASLSYWVFLLIAQDVLVVKTKTLKILSKQKKRKLEKQL